MKVVLTTFLAASCFTTLLPTSTYAITGSPSKANDKQPIVIFIDPPQQDSSGFNITLQSAIFSQHLPITITEDASQADYLVQWQATPAQTNGNTYLFFGAHQNSEVLYSISVSFIDKNKHVVWSDSVNKVGLNGGANIIAIHLKKWMYAQERIRHTKAK